MECEKAREKKKKGKEEGVLNCELRKEYYREKRLEVQKKESNEKDRI